MCFCRILCVTGTIVFLVCRSPASLANELIVAAGSGNLAAVKRLAAERPWLLNAPNSTGRTPLQAAIAGKHVTVMEFLLQRGADCRVRDPEERTAMALAAQSGSEELATRMLLNIPDIDLNQAVRSGDEDAVALVIAGDRGRIGPSLPSLNALLSEPAPLAEAMAANRPRIVRLLMAAGARAEAYSVVHAAELGQIDVLRAYVESGGDVNIVADSYYGTPLHRAAAAGRLDILRYLLSAGAKVNPDADHITTPHSAALQETALHNAAWSGNAAVVEALLSAGARIDAVAVYGWRPVHSALWTDHPRIVRLLLNRGAEIDACVAAGLGKTEEALRLAKQPLSEKFKNSCGPTPAFWAVRCGQLETLKALVATDQSVLSARAPATGGSGKTLMHVAAEADRVEIIRWLVSQGVPLEAKADGGLNFDATPLTAAAATGNTRAAKALLDAGASLEATNRKNTRTSGVAHAGYTPLLAAVAENHKEMVRFLLDCGADIEARACDDATPLCEAARQGNKEICELLLDREAKLGGKSPTSTPLHVAAREHPELLEYLIGRGADVNAGIEQGRPPLAAAVERPAMARAVNGVQAAAAIRTLLKHGARVDTGSPCCPGRRAKRGWQAGGAVSHRVAAVDGCERKRRRGGTSAASGRDEARPGGEGSVAYGRRGNRRRRTPEAIAGGGRPAASGRPSPAVS